MKTIFITIFVVFFTFTSAGYAQNTYTISQVGGITNFEVYNAAGGSLYCGTNRAFSTSADFAPKISGFITNMGALNAGDKVTINLVNDPASLYNVNAGVLPSTIMDQSGTAVFTTSKSGTTIILTRTANNTPGGNMNFTITCARVNLGLARTGTYSEWWAEGFEDISCRWTYSPKTYNSSSANYIAENGGGGYVCTRSIMARPYLYGVYNRLLADINTGMSNEAIKADLLAQFPFLGQDFVTYIHIEANMNILSVGFYDITNFMFDLRADGLGINSLYNNNRFLYSTPFTQGSLPPDLTAETAYTALPAGQYGIAKNADGSYIIVVNYGKLLGDGYASYSSNYDIGSILPAIAATPEIADLQKQLLEVSRAINLAAEDYGFRWLISFADCSTQGEVCYTIQSNLLRYATGNGAAVSPRMCAVSSVLPGSTVEGQTQITVHYVDKRGLALANTAASVGYPPDNISGEPASVFHATPALLTGYIPVSDSAVLTSVAGILGIAGSQVLSGTGIDLNYPSSTVNSGILHVYYVYEPWTALVNPHIRQRAGN